MEVVKIQLDTYLYINLQMFEACYAIQIYKIKWSIKFG